MLPPFSDWLKEPAIPRLKDQVHPLIVHFPIVLLLAAALFVFLAMIFFRKGRWFAVSALLLLALGTAGAFVAVETGQAARTVAEWDDPSEDVKAALDAHEKLSKPLPILFAILTGVYLLILIVPLVIRPLGHPAIVFVLHLVFLAALLAADLLVVHAGYRGTWLVHEHGMRIQMEAPPEMTKAEEPEQEAKAKKPEEKAKPAAPESKKE